MPKRRGLAPEFHNEARRLREQAERQVAASVWDRDPIKQYVRRFGWLQVTQGFVERQREAGVERPLKYLSIPGPNASDIGLLWQAGLLAREDDGFPYVAICDRTSAEQVVANLGRLLGYSNRWLHEAVRGPRSQLASLFPFDVINMDISHPVISGSARRTHALRNIEAIRWMFQLQCGQGFLLLLTTLPDSEAQGRLERVLLNNLDNEEGFRAAYARRYGSLCAGPCIEDHTAFTQLVVPKVIAGIARDLGYASREHFAARYGRQGADGTRYEVICHSFEFIPLGRSGANRYTPRFREVPQDVMSDELSNRVRIQSIRAYEDLLPTLVQREAQDVQEALNENSNLEAELRHEAESLIRWWESDDSQGANSGIHGSPSA